MNLDELKELEAKSTPGELKSIALFGYGEDDDDDDKNPDIVLTLVIDKGGGDLTATKMTDKDEKLYIALRNQALEMISTIERYKTALETVEKDGWDIVEQGPPFNGVFSKERTPIGLLAFEALKDPEKATGGNQ